MQPAVKVCWPGIHGFTHVQRQSPAEPRIIDAHMPGVTIDDVTLSERPVSDVSIGRLSIDRNDPPFILIARVGDELDVMTDGCHVFIHTGGLVGSGKVASSDALLESHATTLPTLSRLEEPKTRSGIENGGTIPRTRFPATY